MNASIRFALLGIAGLAAQPAQAAFRFFDGSNPADVPATISATGLYTNIATKATDTALKYYVVNSALWSDGADKQRWIVLKPGRKVAYNDTTDLFNYPDSTVFVKNFRLRRVEPDTSTYVLWETRLLVNKNDSLGFNHWYGFSYKWNAAGTEASLVNAGLGFDTVFHYYPNGLARPRTYKKWHYPSQVECTICHPVGNNGIFTSRGVAGFFPVQLKRPAPLQPGIDQVQWLFNQGVFSGTPPTGDALKQRWKGLGEPIPAGLTEAQRFAVIDSMARAYIGANCSSCHGVRGIEAASAAPAQLNYDWFDFKPRIEFGAATSATLGLSSLDSLIQLDQPSRYKFIQAVLRSGYDTAQGALWQMSFPRGTDPKFITTGHPGYSGLLYRQFGARNTPWIDSIETRRELEINGDPYNWGTWMFVQPWGSQAWLDSLTAHGVGIDSVVSWEEDPVQMPRTATYLPDTTAMRVLGEWAKTYRTLVRVEGYDSVVSVRGGRPVLARAAMPQLRDRMLIVPGDWQGQARMFSISGRAYALPSVGRGQYAIPRSAPAGLYFFRVGERAFKASVLK